MIIQIRNFQKPLNNLLLPISKKSHKGDFGHIAILEGDDSYKGASRLCALSALRTGAGLVTILVDKIKNSHPSDLAEFIKMPFTTIDKEFLSKISTLVIGPGLGKKIEHQEKAIKLFNKANNYTQNILIDADGLFLLKKDYIKQIYSNIIATPHPKEAAFLLDISTEEIEADRVNAIKKLSNLSVNKSAKVIWILKGANTLVRSPNGAIFLCPGEQPLLSVGGTGDILAGAIAGLIKQCAGPIEAALLGVTLLISCANSLAKNCQKGILPSEIANNFPYMLERIYI